MQDAVLAVNARYLCIYIVLMLLLLLVVRMPWA